MDARTQEEPGLGRMVLLSVVLHVVLFGSIAALTGGSGPVVMPDGVVSVLLVAGPPGPAGEPAGPPGGIPAREPEPPPEEESVPPLPEAEAAEPEPPAPPEEEPAVEEPASEEPPAAVEEEAPPAVEARPAPPDPAKPVEKPVERPTPARASKPRPSASEKPAPPPAAKPKPKPAPREASPGGGAPGSGGGGGGGGGVGSVRLDSAFPYPWYLELIQRRVSDGWLKPGQARPARGTVIYFQIRSDGRVEQVRIERSSGSPLFDRAALRAVRAMNRLAPLPAGFREPHLGIHFEFLP